MIRQPPRSTLFPTRRSSDLRWSRTWSGGSLSAACFCPSPRSWRGSWSREIGRAHSELQSPDHLVCRLLLEKKKVLQTRVALRDLPETHAETEQKALAADIRR